MGKKRKRCEDEEVIKRKIRKLERKLEKKRPGVIYSSEEDNTEYYLEGTPNAAYEIFNESLELVPAAAAAAAEPSPHRSPAALAQPPPPSSPQVPFLSPRAPSPRPRASTPAPVTSVHPTSNDKDISMYDNELEGDILILLGDAPKLDTPLGPPIHKDVASRWQDILIKGLPKEVKEKLLLEYLVPSNCENLIAPTLNPEVKAALSDALVKRDSYLMHKQKQLGIALSALASATTLVLSNETSRQKLLKPLSDACRVLCDIHFFETKSRRNLVISSTNTQLKGTLTESPRDKTWLFGENISDKLKAAKSIQKTGEDLKSQPKQAPRLNFVNKNNKSRLNFKPLHRKTDNKPTSSDSARGRQQPARAPLRAPPPLLRTSRRSPPPRSSRK